MMLELLTPRQREVAALVAIGYGNKMIAAKLGCAVRTVEDHVSDIGDAWQLDRSLDLRVLITRVVLGVSWYSTIERPRLSA